MQLKLQRYKLQSDITTLQRDLKQLKARLVSEQQLQERLCREMKQLQHVRQAKAASQHWHLSSVQLYHNKVVQAAPVSVSAPRGSYCGREAPALLHCCCIWMFLLPDCFSVQVTRPTLAYCALPCCPAEAVPLQAACSSAAGMQHRCCHRFIGSARGTAFGTQGRPSCSSTARPLFEPAAQG